MYKTYTKSWPPLSGFWEPFSFLANYETTKILQMYINPELWVKSQKDIPVPHHKLSPLKYFEPGLSSFMHIMASGR